MIHQRQRLAQPTQVHLLKGNAQARRHTNSSYQYRSL
jgi:hypothetical protein